MWCVWMILFLHCSLSGAQQPFKLNCPDAVNSAAGSAVVLPCFLNPSMSAVNMDVKWTRPDQNNIVVHHYKDKADWTEDQDPSYRDRTAPIKDQLQYGNTSLILKNVQWSDKGSYRCAVQGPGNYAEFTVQVTVEGIGTHPQITVLGSSSPGETRLLCESTGWAIKPELVWTDCHIKEQNGSPLIPEHNGRINVSSSVTVLKSGSSLCVCRVTDGDNKMEEKINISAIGTTPVITNEGTDGFGGVQLRCVSSGWSSEPELQWLDPDKKELNAGRKALQEHADGFSVSRRIIVHRSDTNTYYCRVKQYPSMETSFDISGYSSKIWSGILIGVGFFTGVVVVTIGVLVISFYKKLLCFRLKASAGAPDKPGIEEKTTLTHTALTQKMDDHHHLKLNPSDSSLHPDLL